MAESGVEAKQWERRKGRKYEPFIDLRFEATSHASDVILQSSMFCRYYSSAQDSIVRLEEGDMSDTTAMTSHAVHIAAGNPLTKHAPQLCIIVNVARVKIVSDGAFEKSRILRNNC